MSAEDKSHEDATRSIHAGYAALAHHGAIKMPIYLSSTYVYETAQECKAYFEAYMNASADSEAKPESSQSQKLVYARYGHPNLSLLENRLAKLSGHRARFASIAVWQPLPACYGAYLGLETSL